MKKVVWAWARMLVGVGILGVLVHRLGEGAFLDGLRVIEPTTLLAAIGIGVLTTVFSAWRWCLAARGIGIALPMRTAVADYYQSLFLNATLPGGLLGDVNRAVQNGRSSGSVTRGIRAVVLERSAGQITLFVAGIVALVTYPSVLLTASRVVSVPSPAVLAVAGGALAATAVAVVRARRPGSRTRRAVRTMTSDVRRGLLARGTWPGMVVSSAIVLGGHLATFLLAARAAGATASPLKLLPFAVLALVAMTLPLSIGGWGPREGVTAWAFGAAGLGATEGLTTAVVYGLFAFAAAVPGVAVLVVRWAARFRRTPAAVEPAAVEPAAFEPAAVEPAAVEPAAVEPAAFEPAAVEPAAVEPAAVEPAAVEPAAVGSAAVHEDRLAGDARVGRRAEVDDRAGDLVGV